MISLISAPSNLGLRPPEPSAVPGTSKAPEALREAGLHTRLLAAGGADAGVVIPGRYRDVVEPGHVRNEAALIDHAVRLAERIKAAVDAGHAPLVLGGDCSLVVAAGVSLAGRDAGLLYLDGHTDFRHPGNGGPVDAMGGEALAAAIGLHIPEVADIAGLGPYFAASRTVQVGCRDDDVDASLVRASIADVVTASEVEADPVAAGARAVGFAGSGFWLHLDVDILGPAVMPAVDSPDPGGIDVDQLVLLLQRLAPHAVGADVCIFDPDLDLDGRFARLLADVVVAGLGALGSEVTRRVR
ncbi:arginase family protein [Microbacterium sp. 4R-513]|uniref:arginase family protein n=1 Tax=Microbacterium sp. 4R-513 TaxID=2567934 RepID=UPI0013E0F5A9|nr:arginase family protein [Microbacterium sp. 4R-513]QIG40578.1 arginase family protein [Microbacterium sp. 4R-513]